MTPSTHSGGSARPIQLLLGLAAGLTACPELPAPPPDAGAVPAAAIEWLEGEATLERASRTLPASVGPLLLGDALETGADGRARVRVGPSRTIELGPQARFVLGEDNSGLVLNLAKGTLVSRVPNDVAAAPQVALSVLTPFGLTRLLDGPSEVSVDVTLQGGLVRVLVGAAEFVSKGGQSRQLVGGESQTLLAETPVRESSKKTLVRASGRAELKKKGAKSWKAVAAAGEVLEPGDGLRVREGASILSTEGSPSRLSLAQGTALTFAGASAGEGVETTDLSLEEGELTGQWHERTTSRLRVNELVLAGDLGGQFTLEKSRDGLLVAPQTGDLTLEKDGKRIEVPAGKLATVGPAGIVLSAALPRPLVLPSKLGLKVFGAGQGRVTLAWDGPELDYRIEVAAEPKFEKPILAGLVHEAHVNVLAPSRGTLFWRVREPAGDADLAIGSASFSPERVAAELSRVRNEVPEGTEKTTIFYQDKPPSVTFTWSPSPAAAQYRLRVYRERALGRPLLDRIEVDGRAPLEAGVLVEGAYVWSVTPLSATGKELRGGKMSKLEMVYDNAVRALVVKSPANGAAVRGNKVEAAGIAPLGSRVFVNGRAAPVDSKHRFAITVGLGKSSVVVFRVTQPSGAEAYTVRTVRRRP